ncbi:MAG: hypothetical protein R2793_01585 [Flavobacteriaceae bacterium]
MAKLENILGIQGTVGGITIYKLNGQWVARAAGGGFTREAIKRKESMELVRRQNEEFGLASTANRLFRHALRGLTGGTKIPQFHSRLQAEMQRLKEFHLQVPYGQRDAFMGMMTPSGLKALQAYAYTPEAPWNKIMPYALAPLSAAPEVALQLKAKKPKAPLVGATHLWARMVVVEFRAEHRTIVPWYSEAVELSLEALPSSVSLVAPAPLGAEGPRPVFVGMRYGHQEGDKIMYSKDPKGFSMVCAGEV